MDDLSNIYEEADRYLHIALAKWKTHLPELWEDAYQEGMIQVWRDLEAGVDGGETTKLKILRRASMVANKFFHRNGEYFFGKPKKSRDALTSHQGTLEKVKVYLAEVMPLRNHVYPTGREVADALGINIGSAGKALKRIREGNVDHMVYREDGRMDWDYYSTMSIESLHGESSQGDDVNRSWTDNPKVSHLQTAFEDDAISHVWLVELLNKLSDRHRQVLYLTLFEGYTCGDIGRFFHKDEYASVKGDRMVKSAYNQVRVLIAPYEGACAAGHERTPETCHVTQRADGVYVRVCQTCRSENGTKTVEAIRAKKHTTGRKEKLYCPKNHRKDKRDSQGRLRCSKCRAAAQKAYVAKHKAK